MNTDNPFAQLSDARITPDMMTATETAEAQLTTIDEQLASDKLDVDERLRLSLEKTRLLTELDQKPAAWELARDTFDAYMAKQDYEGAVDACDALFLTEQDELSLAALGMGVWLGVTFPIDPDLTIAMLQHIIDETPEDSDGAAVAAATACYIADIRTQDEQREQLTFFTSQILANVARQHSEVESQEQFNFWMEKLELNDPAKFLIRLRNVVDVLVQENWWFDRDVLREEIPD